MSYFRLERDDIINTVFQTNPSYIVTQNGDTITGSVYLEKQFLETGLSTRTFFGFSEKEGGLTEKNSPFTSSIDFLTAVSGGTNFQVWNGVRNFYNWYSIQENNYKLEYTGSTAATIRIITVPEIYYDRAILTGTFTASFVDTDGGTKTFYDDGRGGLYSGSLSGTLIGNIFYSEGVAILTKGDLSNFGKDNHSTNQKWQVIFKGTHNIPTVIYRCTAPAGQLNASTNPSFYYTPTTGDYKNSKIPVSQSLSPYITTIGLYNEDYELVGTARVAQPVKKSPEHSIMFKLKMDF